MHDIYDPPPALEQEWTPPRREPLDLHDRRPDVPGGAVCSAVRGVDRGMADGAGAGDRHGGGRTLVILECWLTALGFLHRCRPLGLRARWTIFLAALVPWLVGLGVAVTLMLSLFWISDHIG